MYKRSVFFDFDGVIKDSMEVKTDAFYHLYYPFGEEIAEKAKKHHTNNGGVSRFEKFKLYHQIFLNIELSENEIQEWADKFSTLVMQNVIESPYVKGAVEALRQISGTHNLFIITGTPQEEIEEIVNELAIGTYFTEICGSPKNKIYWSDYLLNKYKLDRKNVTFVGDANSDFLAAQKFGFNFVLREHSENTELFSSFKEMKKIPDLTTLIKYI